MKKATSNKVIRNTEGLRSVLFEEMDALRAGKTKPQRAQAIARMAMTIVSTMKLEMDYHTLMAGPKVSKAINSNIAPVKLLEK